MCFWHSSLVDFILLSLSQIQIPLLNQSSYYLCTVIKLEANLWRITDIPKDMTMLNRFQWQTSHGSCTAVWERATIHVAIWWLGLLLKAPVTHATQDQAGPAIIANFGSAWFCLPSTHGADDTASSSLCHAQKTLFVMHFHSLQAIHKDADFL